MFSVNIDTITGWISYLQLLAGEAIKLHYIGMRSSSLHAIKNSFLKNKKTGQIS